MDSTYWQSLKFYHDQTSFHKALLNLIDHAHTSVYVEFYIFDFDEVSLRFLAALRAARQRGVYVQVLVDGIGSQASVDQIERYCRAAHIYYRVYRPLPWTSRFFKKLPRAMWFKVGTWMRKSNRRNHRKMVIIDENEAMIGSFNMTQNDWRDSAVLVKGPGVESFVLAHKMAWFKSRRFGFFRRRHVSKFRKQLREISPFVRINATPFLRRYFYRDLLRRIDTAQKRIYLVTPYFLPRGSLIRTLRKTAKRGVEIKILIPSRTDVQILRWVAHFFIRSLKKTGVQFYEYQPTILHAKYYIIDDWAALGSQNLNHRSFLHDLESEVIIQDEANLNLLLKQFSNDLSQSTPSSSFHKRNLTTFLGRLIFALRYWL